MGERLQFTDGRVIDEQTIGTANCNYRIVEDCNMSIQTISVTKVIAKISLCGALTVNVTEDMDWNPPTPEQIKNLKETFNIDVRLTEDKDDN